jgi:hypothetical protein
MGLHRDPTNYPFSPWVCEIRTRIWNHICCLDAWALSSFGAESCLPATSDTRPPINANDHDWHASRFAKPSEAPLDVPGIKDMTFALVNRGISDVIHKLAHLRTDSFEERENLLRQTETDLNTRYLGNIDRSSPPETVIVAFIEVSFSSLRLSIRHRQINCPKMERSSNIRQP